MAQSADPASYYAEGLKIADSQHEEDQSTADRHAAAVRQNIEMSLRQQQAQQETAQADQQLQLRQKNLEAQATQTAQKYQAQQAYQQAIAGGMDATQAILKFGPAMGAGEALPAAIRAQQANRPKLPKPVPAPPHISMQPGPNGTQIPVLIQPGTGRGSIVPQSAYTPKPAPTPEQWEDSTRKINGKDVPGQISKKTGKFMPYPAADQEGAVTPQQRLQLSLAGKKKAILQKTLGDESALLALAKKKADGKTPTHDDLEAVQGDVQKQIDDLDGQIEKLSGGAKGADNAPKEGDVVKGYTFAGGDPSDKSNWTKAEEN